MVTPPIVDKISAQTLREAPSVGQNKIRRLVKSEVMLSLVLMKIRASTLAMKFVFTLYLARYLNLEAVGFYGLVTAATLTIPAILGFGISYMICRRAVTANLEDLVIEIKYFSILFIYIYSLPLIITLIYGYSSDTLFLSLSILIVLILEHLNNSSYALLQNLSKPIAANILHFLRNTVWVLAFMFVSFFWASYRNVETLMVFWVLGTAFSFFCFLWLVRAWPWHMPMPGTPFLQWFKTEFKQSKKAYMIGVFDVLSTYQDRYLIGLLLGLQMTGVFVFFWQIMSAISNLLWTGVVQVTRPKLVKAFKDKSPAYEKIYRKCLVQALVGAAVASILSVVMLDILLPYLKKPLVIEMFNIYYVMLVAFLLTVIKETQKLRFYSQHRDDLMLKISLISALISCLITLAFVMLWGLWGASISMVLVALCNVLLQNYYKKNLRSTDI